MTLRTFIAVLLLSSATAAMLAWVTQQAHREPISLASIERKSRLSLIEKPLALPDFSLNTHYGDLATQKSFHNHWTLLFSGYSHCVDICTPALSQLSSALDILAEGEGMPDIAGAFLSLDSQRDNSEQLAQYLKHFSPKITGLSGNSQAIEHFTRQMGLVYQRVNSPQNTSGPMFVHSGEIFVTNPQANIVAVITPPLDAKNIASYMQRLVKTQGDLKTN